MKKRIGIISFLIVLFIFFIIIWEYSYTTGVEDDYYIAAKNTSSSFIPSEKGVFERSSYVMKYADMPVDPAHQRSLKTYYNTRSYPGAPPSVPHPVKNTIDIGANDCLKCHQHGGFVQKFNAYAPITPHPNMINCNQCHVQKKTQKLFKNTTFKKNPPPKVGEGKNNSLPGSPPIIPHQIQMRENCLSCHAGPSAAKEIRVSHPERSNCRQCHVPNNIVGKNDSELFKRSLKP